MLFKTVIFSLCLNVVLCWHNGAPEETCEHMTPQHGGPFGDTIPVDMVLGRSVVPAGEVLPISIISRNDTIFGPFTYRGIMMQGRIDDPNMGVAGRVLGSFEQFPDHIRYVPCPTLPPNSVITHSINIDRTYTQVHWRAPTNFVGNIPMRIYYTIVMNIGIYWHSSTEQFTITNPASQNP